MRKPRMVIYIEDGTLRDIITDPEVDIEVLVVDEDSGADDDDQYRYQMWTKFGTGEYPGEFTVDSSAVDVQFKNAN